jgi:hypothetical protein
MTSPPRIATVRAAAARAAAAAALVVLAASPVAEPSPRPAGDVPPGNDPRNVKDPRDITDPRDSTDPREIAVDPLSEPPGPHLYDALYATGQDARLKQALGENGWDLIGYIQTQLDSWLALFPKEGDGGANDPAHATELADKGRKLAKLADESLLDSRFRNYVETVLGWSPEQRLAFREEQDLYKQGLAIAEAAREPSEAAAALTPLQQALERARKLGDGRTQSLALVAIGNLQAANRDEQAARVSMHEAMRVGRELRDLDAVWDALSVLYESAIRTLEWSEAEEALQEQYLIAQDMADQATAQRVLKQLVDLNAFRDQAR